MARLFFRPEAVSELEAAAQWYESKSPLVRQAFLIDFSSLIGRIRRFPESSPIFGIKLRRALFQRHPYAVFYRVKDTDIRVLAVFHLKQNPSKIPRGD